MRHVLITLAVLLLGGCASALQPARFNLIEKQDSPTVWPAFPDVPRYQYLGQLSGESNFPRANRQQTSGRRFLEWIAGLQQDAPDVVTLLKPQSGMFDTETQRIYVTDIGLGAVMVFDELAARLDLWQLADQGETFSSPVAIVKISPDEILVSDAELGRVVRLSSQGSPLGSIQSEFLQRPAGMVFDAVEDRIYVADSGANDIKVFSPQGILLDVIGGPGEAAGYFNAPTHLALSEKHLLVTDTLNARVQVLTLEGEFIRVIGERGLFVGNMVRPKGVAADQDGNIYVIESYFDHMLVFNDTGQMLLSIGGSGKSVGEFYLPSGIWIDDRNRVFIADMHNGRVIVLQYLGST